MFENYKKRPVAVKACRLTEDNIDEVQKWIGQQGGSCRKVATYDGLRLLGLKILTLEGLMNAIFGSWIIQGIEGEFYSCTNEIFEKTYDKVQDSAMLTRADYMARKVSHREYYADVIKAMGGAKSISLPVSLDVVQKALASGDEHLNSIPLAHWDAAVPKLRNAKHALEQRGDYLTLGTGVCILKEAARIRATTERAVNE